MYADTFITYIRWEAYQPNPNSPRSVMRSSYRFKWRKGKPFLVAGMIRDSADEIVKIASKNFFETFFPESLALL